MTLPPRILIAGIGNIFFGDDAFGVEVAQRLARRALPEGVRAVDFGIRSYDLAFALMDGYDVTLLVDATPQGRPAGTVFLIEPDLDMLGEGAGEVVNAHSMNPVRVLQLVRSLGGVPGPLYLVGCQPAVLETDDGYLGLSPEVEAAVPTAIDLILSLVEDVRQGRPLTPSRPAEA